MSIVVYGDQDFLEFVCQFQSKRTKFNFRRFIIKINMSPIGFLHQKKDDVIEMTPNMRIPHIYAFCPFPTHGNIPLINWQPYHD